MKTFIVQDDQANSLMDVYRVLELLGKLGFELHLGKAIAIDVRDEGTARLVQDLLEKSAQRFNVIGQEPAVAAVIQPAARLYPRHCEACGAEFTPKRKDSFYCEKAECQKAHKHQLAARSWAKSKTGSPEDPADPADQEDPTHQEDPAPAAGGAETWTVQSGPRMGQRLTSSQMGTALRLRDLEEGQLVEHQQRGRYKIVARDNGSLTMAHVRSNGNGES